MTQKILQFQAQLDCKYNEFSRTYMSNVCEVLVVADDAPHVLVPSTIYTCDNSKINIIPCDATPCECAPSVNLCKKRTCPSEQVRALLLMFLKGRL